MSGAITRGVLFVHSAPRALCPHIEWAAGGVLRVRVSMDWTEEPAAPGMFLLIPKHGRSIGETQRQRYARQPHGDRPGDLRRGIRTKDQRPPRCPIQELIAVFDQFRLKPGSQNVQILERGKNDLIVAPPVDVSE